MPGNTFGQIFRLTTFGESHGAAIGGVVDGCPAGLPLDLEAVQVELDRRRPGSTPLGTARNEADKVEVLSGVFEGVTLGTPIGFLLRNADGKSSDYDALKNVYRPSHADYTWERKFGVRDHRGGGRASARETAARVVGGAIARQLLASAGMHVQAYVDQVGEVKLEKPLADLDLKSTWASDVRCPDSSTSQRMAALIEQVRGEGDSVGGAITCAMRGVPVGLGEPVFDKLHADLGKAMLSINAVKGFESGSGFGAIVMRGSEHNDQIGVSALSTGESQGEKIRTRSNRSGGIQGGISNGEDIICRIAFKPVATIAKAQQTVDKSGQSVTLEAKGRHDPCVVPRAVPIVEAMACLVLADHWLRQRSTRVA
ncbi:MAG: chorismate synthase [Flavobacteriales bacterium]|nr:chorismate synthase [Flavobacteriales bacterium]